jgi:hypothetical protein
MDNVPNNEDDKRSDGLLRLAYALSRKNQDLENDDLMKFLETATVPDLRNSFPVLLNWVRNNTSTENSISDINIDKDNNNDNDDSPVVLKTTTTTEEVAKRIVKVLEEAIEYEAEDDMCLMDDDEREEIERKNGLASSLRMKLAGFVHTNHEKMKNCQILVDLERRTKAKIQSDQAALNTMNMINMSSPSSLSISQHSVDEEVTNEDSSWGVPRINIDLGLGLQAQISPADVCEEFIQSNKQVIHPFSGRKVKN